MNRLKRFTRLARRPLHSSRIVLGYYLDNKVNRNSSAVWLTSPKLLQLAMAINRHGQPAGSTSYRKFIVLTSPRSGSNLLCSSLDQHDQLVCKGELFGEDGPHIGVSPRNFNSNWLAVFRELDAERFLEYFHHKPYPPTIQAVGFKVFPRHLTHKGFRPVISSLLHDPATQVIVLQRPNYLERYLSLKKARESRQWAHWLHEGKAGSSRQTQAVELSVKELNREFIKLAQEDRVIAGLVSGRPFLPLSYDDLCTDFETQLGRVQEYLGVPTQAVPVRTRKQSNGSLAENIANYAELKQHFHSSPWGRFFT